MALIKCVECGKEISDRASACPNCGCPVEPVAVIGIENEDEQAQVYSDAALPPPPVVVPEEAEKSKSGSGVAIFAVVAVVLVLIIGSVVGLLSFMGVFNGDSAVQESPYYDNDQEYYDNNYAAPTENYVVDNGNNSAANAGYNSGANNSYNSGSNSGYNNSANSASGNSGSSSGNKNTHKHSFSDATCTAPGQCSCGETRGSALGHNYVGGSCSRCGTADPGSIRKTLVYEDSRVKISYKQVTDRGVVFEVENRTDVTITIQADTIAINQASTQKITMSDDVAPHSTGDVIAKCTVPFTGDVGVISGQLRVIDFNKSFDTYDAKFVNVVVNPSVSYNTPTPRGTLVYSDSKVNIYYKETTNSGVIFDVENLTDVVITIQADAISTNGVSTDRITMSDDVSPYSVGEVCAKCSTGITGSAVNTIGGTLRIIDFNKSFNTYDATFVNVSV